MHFFLFFLFFGCARLYSRFYLSDTSVSVGQYTRKTGVRAEVCRKCFCTAGFNTDFLEKKKKIKVDFFALDRKICCY